MKIHEISSILKSPIVKQRTEAYKTLELDKLKRENEKLGERILNKSSSYSKGLLMNNYQNHLYYRQFNKKFELPRLEVMGNKLLNKTKSIKDKSHNRSKSVTNFFIS